MFQGHFSLLANQLYHVSLQSLLVEDRNHSIHCGFRYLATRQDERADEYLFLTANETPFVRDHLRKTLWRIGRRAGVPGAGVHRFRHTFAINYLRNGGDPYTLQIMLGHSTMEMVRRYLSIAQSDVDKNHKLASPVDNWRL